MDLLFGILGSIASSFRRKSHAPPSGGLLPAQPRSGHCEMVSSPSVTTRNTKAFATRSRSSAVVAPSMSSKRLGLVARARRFPTARALLRIPRVLLPLGLSPLGLHVHARPIGEGRESAGHKRVGSTDVRLVLRAKVGVLGEVLERLPNLVGARIGDIVDIRRHLHRHQVVPE